MNKLVPFKKKMMDYKVPKGKFNRKRFYVYSLISIVFLVVLSWFFQQILLLCLSPIILLFIALTDEFMLSIEKENHHPRDDSARW